MGLTTRPWNVRVCRFRHYRNSIFSHFADCFYILQYFSLIGKTFLSFSIKIFILFPAVNRCVRFPDDLLSIPAERHAPIKIQAGNIGKAQKSNQTESEGINRNWKKPVPHLRSRKTVQDYATLSVSVRQISNLVFLISVSYFLISWSCFLNFNL